MPTKITRKILTNLYRPPAASHKGDNGRLLIISGSPKYHGATVLCSVMASKLVDFVYLHTTKENFGLIQKVREKLAEFIYINENDLPETVTEVDAILAGPGLELNKRNRRLINDILKKYPSKKILLDAGALRLADLKLLHQNCLLTPHAGEFRALFGEMGDKIKSPPFRLILPRRQAGGGEEGRGVVSVLAKLTHQYPFLLVLKGQIDYIAQNGRVYYNATGNAGMTKGGTGDVLAGIIAGLLTKNDPLTSACAGVYINGKAGDNLYKKFGYNFSAGELIPAAQRVLRKPSQKSSLSFRTKRSGVRNLCLKPN